MSGSSSPSSDTTSPAIAPEVVEVEAGPAEPPPVPGGVDPALLSVATLPPRMSPAVTVADLMTRKVITVEENEPIGDLEVWMARFRFRHLPVVDAGMKLVGLITRTDLLHAALGTGPDGKPTPKADASTVAHAIMNKNVVTARLDAPLVTALEVMLHEKLGCLPVVLADNTLVGVVTETDFNKLALELLKRRA